MLRVGLGGRKIGAQTLLSRLELSICAYAFTVARKHGGEENRLRRIVFDSVGGDRRGTKECIWSKLRCLGRCGYLPANVSKSPGE